MKDADRGEFSAIRKLLTCRTEGRTFSLAVEKLAGVSELTPITPLPGSVRPVMGLVFLKGMVQPCLDSGELFYNEAKDVAARAKAVLIEREGMRFVLAVDEVLGIEEIGNELEDGKPVVASDEGETADYKSVSEIIKTLEGIAKW